MAKKKSVDPGVEFKGYLTKTGKRVNASIRKHLPRSTAQPALIHESMRYTALSGGKLLRPCLVLLAYGTAGGRGKKADPVAAAVELVHAFSLIHDDLPCMDDDDFRRGQPSNHKVYGEAVAVLAGDGLLSRAFQILAAQRSRKLLGPEITAALVEELAGAIGSQGVIGGQVLDIFHHGDGAPKKVVDYIHRHKTAKLFSCALRMGGVSAGAGKPLTDRLGEFGETTGLAFQVVDDILSVAGSYDDLGREPGRDEAQGKATYPAAVGLEGAQRAVNRLLKRARVLAEAMPANRVLFHGYVDLLDRRRQRADGGLLGSPRP